MGLLSNRNRQLRLEDDADAGGGDSSRALLPHSKKTALRALAAQVIAALGIAAVRVCDDLVDLRWFYRLIERQRDAGLAGCTPARNKSGQRPRPGLGRQYQYSRCGNGFLSVCFL